MEHLAIYDSPIGQFLLKAQEDAITGLFFLEDGEAKAYEGKEERHYPIIKECMKQLDEYFEGKRKVFDLKINNMGTEFRQHAWKELEKIPYGEVRTYKDMAIAVGNPKAVRAVGGANHHNNISIIVPCHRVIGSNGKLVGYGGQVWRKEWLLEHEQKYCKQK